MDIELIRKTALFESLTTTQLRKLSGLLTEVRYPSNAIIFREGDPAASMYIIGEGKVRISKRISGVGEEALAIFDKGQYFGEMALIEDGLRSADATAYTNCLIWEFERDRMEQAMFADKDFSSALLWTFVRTLSMRLRETNEKLRAFFALSYYPDKESQPSMQFPITTPPQPTR